MARAIIKHGRIVKLTIQNIGIEVGVIPKGVGLERLRWNGTELIDLMDLDEIYVDRETRVLHIEDKGNCEKVKMKYNERFDLFKDPITKLLRIKTQEDKDRIKNDIHIAKLKNKSPSLEHQVEIILGYLSERDDLTKELKELLEITNSIRNKLPKL